METWTAHSSLALTLVNSALLPLGMEQQMQDACAVTVGQREIVKGENHVVLRIDNVPWVRLHVVFSF